MNYFIAAEGIDETSRRRRRLLSTKSNVPTPTGILHAYSRGAATTLCGIALETLAPYPDVIWPGGVALSNPHCPTCGEGTVSD